MIARRRAPRVAPLEPPFAEEAQVVLDQLGPPIQLFRVFARRPELARGVTGWGQYYLSRNAALSLRHRELVIDRTTSLCGADYEWGIHIDFFAEKVGLSREQVASLAGGSPDDACWPVEDRAVLSAVDELHTSCDLSDQTWADLADAVGDDGAVELTLLAGWYHAISFAVRALRLPLEPGTSDIAWFAT